MFPIFFPWIKMHLHGKLGTINSSKWWSLPLSEENCDKTNEKVKSHSSTANSGANWGALHPYLPPTQPHNQPQLRVSPPFHPPHPPPAAHGEGHRLWSGITQAKGRNINSISYAVNHGISEIQSFPPKTRARFLMPLQMVRILPKNEQGA